ncbi:DUF7793 family protein [Flavivirga jejuensis]|uniref:DUF7793 domain-containing protein n=1 Tax=Flavivirga jejuensis TaxID=870487 RepID=A0ABT8WVI1_9FLAO|nr:hypothetical protein [Flavivirga jejuensis]MDO5977114.1 hypothetical protein [Flavivirga jejuensis]
MQTYFQNTYAKYIIKDSILHITYKEGVFLDITAAKEIVKDRIVMQNGKALPVLCDTRLMKDSTKSARDYLALEGSTLVKAVAFVTEPSVSEFVIKIYIRTSNPPVKTEIFSQISDAKEYLLAF